MARLDNELLTLINESEGHLTAEEAFLLAKKKKLNVSLASVYRVLGKLSSQGKIKRFSVLNGSDIFDKTTTQHEHLVCTICGKVKDVHIKNLKKTLIDKTGVNIEDYDLCLKYVCEDCLNKN